MAFSASAAFYSWPAAAPSRTAPKAAVWRLATCRSRSGRFGATRSPVTTAARGPARQSRWGRLRRIERRRARIPGSRGPPGRNDLELGGPRRGTRGAASRRRSTIATGTWSTRSRTIRPSPWSTSGPERLAAGAAVAGGVPRHDAQREGAPEEQARRGEVGGRSSGRPGVGPGGNLHLPPHAARAKASPAGRLLVRQGGRPGEADRRRPPRRSRRWRSFREVVKAPGAANHQLWTVPSSLRLVGR